MAKFKRIGILSSGGDAPGMNACIRAVARKAMTEGLEVMAIYGGYSGLINGDIKQLTTQDVSNIVTRGGTVLYSSRCPEFKTAEGMKKALENCEKFGIDAIIAIGGDGTFRGATDLTAHGIPSIGIPATIDNDITATEYTIGFDTALNTVLSMIDYLRDTCEAHARCNVVEVMGRNCGFIALYSAIASGAVSVAIPEVPFDESFAMKKIRSARETGKRGLIVVISEGMKTVGDLKYSEYFAGRLNAEANIDTKFARCGHIIRGGSPTLRDRLASTQLGVAAVETLLAGKSNVVMASREGNVEAIDINFALIVDRMYKKTLKPGDLDAFTEEQIEEMKTICERRDAKIKKLYQTAYEVCR